jgi:hypothetical protein
LGEELDGVVVEGGLARGHLGEDEGERPPRLLDLVEDVSQGV